MRGFTHISCLMTDFGLPATRSWVSFFCSSGGLPLDPTLASLSTHSIIINCNVKKICIQKLVPGTFSLVSDPAASCLPVLAPGFGGQPVLQAPLGGLGLGAGTQDLRQQL